MRLHNMSSSNIGLLHISFEPSIKAIGLLLINRNIAAMGECQREFAGSMGFDLIVTNGIIVSTRSLSCDDVCAKIVLLEKGSNLRVHCSNKKEIKKRWVFSIVKIDQVAFQESSVIMLFEEWPEEQKSLQVGKGGSRLTFS